MIRSLTTVAVVSALLSAPAIAADDMQKTEDFLKQDAYFKALVGFADLGLQDSALAVTGTYGKRLTHIHPKLSAEIDLGLSLTDAESSRRDIGGNAITTSASYFLLGGYAVFEHPLDDKISLYGRGGLVYVSSDAKTRFPGGSTSASDSSIEVGIGAGAKYRYTPTTAFIVDLSHIDDYDAFSVGAQFEF